MRSAWITLAVSGVNALAGKDSEPQVAAPMSLALDAYSALQSVSLRSASSGSLVPVTSLWRRDIAFSLGGERCAIDMLRHFG